MELLLKVEMELFCLLMDVQCVEYVCICLEGFMCFGDDVGVVMWEKFFGFFVLFMCLCQICCDLDMLLWFKVLLLDLGKILLLVEKLVEIVSSGYKVVIFLQFVMLFDCVCEVFVMNFLELLCYEFMGMMFD